MNKDTRHAGVHVTDSAGVAKASPDPVFLQGQIAILERIAGSHALQPVLIDIVQLVEKSMPDVLASILLLDDEGLRFNRTAAVSLPPEYIRAIEGEPIGPEAGSCGTAAYHRRPVIVTDIATDPLWKNYKLLALPHGLRACWSTPILCANDQVVGTFAMYYRESKAPAPAERALVEVATHLAAVAIQRLRAETAVRASEQRLELALQATNLGVWDWDVPSGKVVFSDCWANMLGYDRSEIKGSYEEWERLIHFEDKPRVVEVLNAHLAGKTEYYEAEMRLLAKNGEWRWILGRGKVFTRSPDGQPLRMSGTHQDITFRKHEELAIQAIARGVSSSIGQEFYHSLVKNLALALSVDYVFIGRLEGPEKIRTVATWAHGKPAADFVYDLKGTPCENVLARDLCCYEENVQKLFPDDPMIRELKAEGFIGTPLVMPDGTPLGLLGVLHTKPIRDAGHARSMLQIFAARASAELVREQAEDRIRRLNRLYAVSSCVNEAIVRIRNPQELYTQACRIAVEDGLLRLAWVGLHDEETGQIKPIIHWGVDKGYLASISVTSHDEPRGHGPVGTSLRTGKYAVSNDIAQDPNFFSKIEAAKRGYRSCASFPLKAEGRVYGTIVMYADQVGFFNHEEVRLLNALAENISFAVESGEKEIARHRADQALHENQRVLSTLLTNLVGMAYRMRWDEFWTAEFVSGGCRELTGWTPDDLLHNRVTNYEQITHPEDRARVRSEVEAALKDGKRFELTYRIITAKNEVKWVWERGVGVFDDHGTLLFLEGFITDITERRQSAERARQQAALLDKAQDVILVQDLEGRILYWNKSAERVLGWSEADVLGRDARLLLNKEAKPVEHAMHVVLKRGEWHGELSQITKSGQEVMLESRWTLVRDENGRPQSILAINTDITEKKLLETLFYRTQRLDSLGTLASGIAHDLNNVLAPILMSIELLQERVTDSDGRALLGMLENSAQRGADIVRQVLTFSRGAEGKRTLVPPFDLLHETAKIIKETFPKTITVEVSTQADVWQVHVDPTQLHQVLLNLSVNARDAMPNGGTLRLTAENSTIDEHYAALQGEVRPGSYVIISVSDTGTGIAPEIRENIFDPFFTTKEPGKGTGLGLSTVLTIVRRHGGFINVFSEAGTGATFKVFLPAELDTSIIQRKPTPGGPLPRGNGELILVVDDEPAVRGVTQQTLEASGYKVITAVNGAEAVAMFAERPNDIQLVLTDMMMPVMDGATTVAALRRIRPQMKIVTTSGVSGLDQTAKVTATHANAFLPKPYTAETLLRTLHQVLHSGTDWRK